jgi:hypothetical protein
MKIEIGGACCTYGDRRGVYSVLWGDLTDRDHLEYLNKDGKTVLKWIFKKWDGKTWTVLL